MKLLFCTFQIISSLMNDSFYDKWFISVDFHIWLEQQIEEY